MRRSTAALTALALSVLALAGCSSAPAFDGESCEGAFTGDFTGIVATDAGLGDAPDAVLRTPIKEQSEKVEQRIVGEGRAITAGDQVFVADIALYNGTDGEELVSTEFNGDLSRLSNVNSWSAQVPAVASALTCATGGSRLIAAFPAADLGEQASAGLAIDADDTVVAIIDVLKVYLPHAEGDLQYNDALGLPTVVRAPDGRPGIIVPDADAPTDLVVQTLIKGDGETVTGDDPVRVHYTGVLWDERTVFDSSWDSNPAQFDLSSVVEGFSEGLKGQTVGSQVLLVIPPEFGYGDSGQGSVPAGATLVFVVDILGVDTVGE